MLTEHVTDWLSEGCRVDRKRRLVTNVALTGATSKNGYRYDPDALAEAVPLYDGKPVFLDHAKQTQARSTRDLVGFVVHPRFESGRVRGDVRVLGTEAGRTFLALVESGSKLVGMSHVVLGRRSDDGTRIRAIDDVLSIDAVLFPATPASFSEHEQPPIAEPDPLPGSHEHLRAELQRQIPDLLAADPELESATLLQLAIFPTHVALHLQTDADTSPTWHVARYELNDEPIFTSALQRTNDPQSAPDAEVDIEAELRRSGLPTFALTDTFRTHYASATQEQRRDLLADRHVLIERTKSPRVTSTLRQSSDEDDSLTQRLLHAVRKR